MDDDTSFGNAAGTTVTVNPLVNDTQSLDPTSVKILDASGLPVSTLYVAGQGLWSVDATTGLISFDPDPNFTGDPTPISYEVSVLGTTRTVTADVTITYQVTSGQIPFTGTSAVAMALAALAVLAGGLNLLTGSRRPGVTNL